MAEFRKVQQAALLVIAFSAVPAFAAGPDDAARLDELFAELKQPDRPDWQKIEGEINQIWARSGSPSMDLLLQEGAASIQAEDFPAAVERLSALIDHAPDFAEGWNARATAFYLMGEYSLSVSDVEHVLLLEPRHFGALAGLGLIFEEMNQPAAALKALEAAQAINPHRENVNEAVDRLKRASGEAEL